MQEPAKRLEHVRDFEKAIYDFEAMMAVMNAHEMLLDFQSAEETLKDLRKKACLTKEEKKMIVKHHDFTIEKMKGMKQRGRIAHFLVMRTLWIEKWRALALFCVFDIL